MLGLRQFEITAVGSASRSASCVSTPITSTTSPIQAYFCTSWSICVILVKAVSWDHEPVNITDVRLNANIYLMRHYAWCNPYGFAWLLGLAVNLSGTCWQHAQGATSWILEADLYISHLCPVIGTVGIWMHLCPFIGMWMHRLPIRTGTDMACCLHG